MLSLHLWFSAVLSRASIQRSRLLSSASQQLLSVRTQRGHASGPVAWAGERRPSGAEPASLQRSPVRREGAGALHPVSVPPELPPALLLRPQRVAWLNIRPDERPGLHQPPTLHGIRHARSSIRPAAVVTVSGREREQPCPSAKLRASKPGRSAYLGNNSGGSQTGQREGQKRKKKRRRELGCQRGGGEGGRNGEMGEKEKTIKRGRRENDKTEHELHNFWGRIQKATRTLFISISTTSSTCSFNSCRSLFSLTSLSVQRAGY